MEIKPPELLQALRRIEERSAVDTAHRALQNSGQIFRYATTGTRSIAAFFSCIGRKSANPPFVFANSSAHSLKLTSRARYFRAYPVATHSP
ncbi:MAG: hypothetical protein P4L50_14590 [Anaerolineaceae bacterium]|nr:hypothetical protein [Anaerolineaceae bacterium]